MKYRRGIKSVLLLLFCCISSTTLYGQQPQSGNYASGAFTGMKGAVTPGPGTFVIENGTLIYNTRDFVDSNGNERNIPTVNALANRTILGYTTKFKILGGTYFPAVILPFANVALRPEPGSAKDFQLGDLILQPLMLGWNSGNMHYQFGYNIWLPTARFNEGASNNVGRGLYSHLFTGGATWLQGSDLPWSATVMVRYEIMGKQRDTDIEPGNVVIIEGGVGKEVASGLDLGLTYYATTQVSNEKGSPVGTDTSKYRAASLGPEINWRPNFFPGFQLALRSYFEFAARNSSQGVFTVVSLAYFFGSGS